MYMKEQVMPDFRFDKTDGASRVFLPAVFASFVLALAPTLGMAHDGDTSTPSYRSQYWFVDGGYAGGGDRVATVELYNAFGRRDETESIRAGEGAMINVGSIWELPASGLSLQAKIGVHADGVSSYRDSVSFMYFPLDFGVHYTTGRNRIGVGGTYAINPELDLEDVDGGTVEYDNALGAYLQYEYLFPRFSIGVRAAALEFDVDKVTNDAGDRVAGNFDSVDGDHIGVVFTWVF